MGVPQVVLLKLKEVSGRKQVTLLKDTSSWSPTSLWAPLTHTCPKGEWWTLYYLILHKKNTHITTSRLQASKHYNKLTLYRMHWKFQLLLLTRSVWRQHPKCFRNASGSLCHFMVCLGHPFLLSHRNSGGWPSHHTDGTRWPYCAGSLQGDGCPGESAKTYRPPVGQLASQRTSPCWYFHSKEAHRCWNEGARGSYPVHHLEGVIGATVPRGSPPLFKDWHHNEVQSDCKVLLPPPTGSGCLHHWKFSEGLEDPVPSSQPAFHKSVIHLGTKRPGTCPAHCPQAPNFLKGRNPLLKVNLGQNVPGASNR